MKLYLRLIITGILLLILAIGFAACGTAATPEPVPATEAPAPTDAPPTEAPAAVVLEIVGFNETKSLTLDELMALPVTEGYAGIKSSTGKITPPVPFKGVALKDLVEVIGGMDEVTGFNVVAKDGYSITFSYDQINKGTFIAYDPATGDELKNPVELTAILAYEANGKAFDVEQDGVVRLAIVSPEMKQVTDGHWSVKWVTSLEAKALSAEWNLLAEGALTETIDRASVESCGAPQCHGASWTDDKAQEWVGVPLYILVGAVDDEITHEGPAFNDALADAGYTVDVVASDGYKVSFDAARVKRNKDIIVAFKVNDNPLTDKYFPLRLVGAGLEKSEMAGMIANIKVNLPVAEDASTGSVNVPADQATFTITDLVDQELTLDEAALRKMEVLKITAEHPKKGKGDYEGISLNALLDLASVQDGAATLVVTSADGYMTEVSLAEVQACADCLLGFTDTADKFSLVMPGLPSNVWAKEVVKIEVK